MDYSTGKLAFIFIIAVTLSWAGAWVLAYRYRSAMRRLMSAPADTVASAAPGGNGVGIGRAADVAANLPPLPVTANDNRRADLRLAALLIALSCLMALSSAALFLVFGIDDPFSFKRLAVLALAHTWPVVPVLGLMWRWSRVAPAGHARAVVPAVLRGDAVGVPSSRDRSNCCSSWPAKSACRCCW